MKIDDALLAYLEGLSCLELLPDEKEPFKNELSEILRFMETLDQFAVESPTDYAGHPSTTSNAFREDIVTESADRASILSNAADHTDEFFKSPLTVETTG